MSQVFLKHMLAIALVLGAFAARAPVYAANSGAALTSAPDSLVQTVQYYSAPRYYGRPRYYGPRYYRPYRSYARPRYYGRRYYR